MSSSGSKSKSTTSGSAASCNANRKKKEPATQDCLYQVPRNWTQLQREGWTFREGLTQFVYVRPDGPDPKSGRAKLGVDYFKTPGDMAKHCEASFQLNRALKRKKSGGDPARRSGKNTESKAAATKERKNQSNASVEPTHTAATAAAAAAKKDETTANGNNTAGSRRDQLRAIIRPEMDWAIVWPTLKDNGWAAKPGRGLVSWYLCCPEFANKSVGDMLQHGKRGQDYFCSSDDLRQYCVDDLGWVGYEIKKIAKDDAVDAKAADESSRGDGTASTADQLEQLIAPDMHWMEVMAALKASGWTVKPGRGLITYYYCNSKFANESISNMLVRGARNEDYFCSSQELKDYCHSKYGWNGRSEAADLVITRREVQEEEKRAPAPKKTKNEAQKKRGRSRPRRQTNDGRKRQRKNTIIDLTEDASDLIETHGRERSNRSLTRLSEELAKVTMEKNEIQKELISAKDDLEDAQELAQQQTLAIDVLQGRIDKFAGLLAEVGVDAKVIQDIRDRPLSSGH